MISSLEILQRGSSAPPLRSFEPTASLQHLDLITVGIGDEEEAGDELSIRCEFDQLARRETLGDRHADTLSSINNLGNLLKNVRKNYPDAEKHYRLAIKLDPERTDVRDRLEALLLKKHEALQQAKEQADRAAASLLAEEDTKAAPTKPSKSSRKKAAQRQKKDLS